MVLPNACGEIGLKAAPSDKGNLHHADDGGPRGERARKGRACITAARHELAVALLALPAAGILLCAGAYAFGALPGKDEPGAWRPRRTDRG